MTALSIRKKIIFVNGIKTTLFSAKKMMKDKIETSQHEALAVIKSGRLRGKDKSKVIYYYCNKIRHLKRNLQEKVTKILRKRIKDLTKQV